MNAPSGSEIRDPEIEVDFGEQRRWTVLLRVILAIPQIIVFGLVSIGASVVSVIGWFAALFTGRLPGWAAEFLAGYVAWLARLYGYTYLLVDRYPPFTFEARDYPVRVALPAAGPLNRLAVLLRILLLIPVSIVNSLVSCGWFLAGFIIWLVVLATGRMPAPLFLATAAVLRYAVRYQAYACMLTSAYPKKLFGEAPVLDQASRSHTPRTRPLVLPPAARVLLVLFIVLGLLAYAGQAASAAHQHPTSSSSPHRNA